VRLGVIVAACVALGGCRVVAEVEQTRLVRHVERVQALAQPTVIEAHEDEQLSHNKVRQSLPAITVIAIASLVSVVALGLVFTWD